MPRQVTMYNKYWRRRFSSVTLVSARYWSIRDMDSGQTSSEIAELQFRATAGGSKLSGTFTASSTTFGGDVNRLDDGDIGTEWWSQTTGAGTQWVAIDLGAGNDSEVREIFMQATDYSPQRCPVTWGLYYSNNGSTWTRVYQELGAGGAYTTNSESRTFDVT